MCDVGTVVAFPEWDDSTGEPIMMVGTLQSAFRDPDERHARNSGHVETASGRVYTPYLDECRPAKPQELEGMAQCVDGLHSWVDAVGRLPAITTCTRCGDRYGCPA